MAACGGTPARNSSRMRSLISTLASTAMPMVNARPAKPGSVIVTPNSDITATTITRLSSSATHVIRPNMR
ncbi:hypothetical protein FQZ97_1186430 [compost metagenome]